MRILRRQRHRRSNSVRHVILFALGGLVGLAACDSGTGPGEASIEGTWETSFDPFTQYLEITADAVTEYWGVPGDCFEVTVFNILNRDGETVTLQAEGSSRVFDVLLSREGASLRLVDPTTQQSWLLSDAAQDVSTLTQCGEGAGGDDPAIDCATLPAITLGQPIEGELTASDSIWFGSYYDLYGLTLTAQQQVTITQSSVQIDSYVYLYDAGGAFIDSDDDGAGRPDSELAVTLDAGCYRVEATSYFPEEVGSYTLTVN